MKYLFGYALCLLFGLTLGCDRAPERPTAALEDPAAAEEETAAPEPTGPRDQYVIDPDSEFTFTGYYVAGSQTGGFLVFDGHWEMHGDEVETARSEVVFLTDTVYSSDDRLTRVLVGDAFFDSLDHPEGTFKLNRVRATDDGYTITGDLTLRGVTKTISFPAAIQVADDQVRIQAEFQVDRNWWEMGKGGLGDYALRDRVDIVIDVMANKEE